jgi:DNA-binding beta-propeller fold protein YncE
LKKLILTLTAGLCIAFLGRGQNNLKPPLALVQTLEMPEIPTFMFAGDLQVDLKRDRLFAALQATKSVGVFDLKTGKQIASMPVEYPHTVMYMSEFDQLYVTDQSKSEPSLKIYDGKNYHLVKLIKLQARADAAVYDPDLKQFFVDNGGAAAKQDYSLISVIDTTTGTLIGDIKVPGETLEALTLEPSSSRLYVNMRDEDEVGIVDRKKRTFLEAWRVTKGHSPTAIALDEKHHRLFVACRSTDMHGDIVVFDTQTGRELDSLPIGGMVDELNYDEPSGRLYASCGTGEITVYQLTDADKYALLGRIDTGIMARSGLLVPELNRYFSSVPRMGTQMAKILVFKVQ